MPAAEKNFWDSANLSQLKKNDRKRRSWPNSRPSKRKQNSRSLLLLLPPKQNRKKRR